MGKGRIIVIVVIIVAIVVLGLIFIGPILVGMSNNNSMQVDWYAGSEQVAVPPSYAFWADSKEVTSFTVTLNYEVISLGEVQGLEVVGEVTVTVRLNTITAGLVSEQSAYVIQDSTTLTGHGSKTYSLSSIISVTETGKTNGWKITVSGTLHAEGTVDDEARSDDWSDSVTYTIVWQESGFEVTGNVVGVPG